MLPSRSYAAIRINTDPDGGGEGKDFFYHVFWDETCHRKLIGDSGFFMFEFESWSAWIARGACLQPLAFDNLLYTTHTNPVTKIFSLSPHEKINHCLCRTAST